MTLVADTYLGNLHEDDDLASRVESGETLSVAVDETERRRSRFRTTAEDGTDVGVVVGRELRAGDVLSADGTLVRVSLESVEAMVVDFTDVDPDATAVTAALELGHVVGNRHVDLAIEGERAYLPIPDTRERLEATVEPHLPEGAAVDYDEVSPTIFDEGESGGGHSHGDHDHSHGDHTHGVRDLDLEESS